MQQNDCPEKKNHWIEEENAFQNSFAQIPIPTNSHVVLRIHVVRGRNISVGLSDWVDTPDAQLYLNCTSSYFDKAYKTDVKRNTVNPEWNEHFAFVIAEEEQFTENNQLVKIQAKLYDVDRLGPDDYIGKVDVDLSDLEMDAEKEITLSFKKQGEVDITVKKEVKRNLDLRRSYKLCEEEITYRKMRKAKVMEALQRVLGDDGPRNLSETPTISLATSGGGYRAMMASAGFMEGLFELKLFDTLTYWSSLSGSSWYMAMVYLKQALQSHESLVSFNNELRSLCEKHLLSCVVNPSFIKAYLEERGRTSEHERPITLVNLYSFILGWTFFGLEHINTVLSETKHSVTEASLPFHMMTTVHVRDNMPLSAFKVGIEMNGFEISAPLYGVHVPTELYNSDWSHGIVLRKLEEFPAHYHMGAAGSVFAILAKAALKKVNVDTEIVSTNDNGDGVVLEKEAVEEMNTHINNGSVDNVGDIVRESEDDEKQEVKRAASILNFIYKLPEQISYSLDPFLQQTPECEPSKGFKRDITCDSKTIKLVDAGLSCNVPSEHVLRPQRTTDILIVLEATKHQDQQLDFTTLLTAADQARQEGLKFPKFSKAKLLADKFKELYVIEDEDGDPDCPVVLWFTLSTRKFCNLKNYTPIHGQPARYKGEPFNSFPGSFAEIYHTYRLSSSPLIFDRLRELSRFNLLENKDILLQKIVERIYLKREKMRK